MQKLSLSDHIFVFVCYQPGAGGENLSTNISRLANCVPLEFYVTPERRTIIMHEFFEKTFLNLGAPLDKLISAAQNILQKKCVSDKIHVVPSHRDHHELSGYFPNSKFIRIVNADRDQLDKLVNEKVYSGKFRSLQELKGYCLIFIDYTVLQLLFKQKKIHLGMTIGDIYKIIKPFINKELYDIRKNIADSSFNFLVNNRNVFNLEWGQYESHKEHIEHFINEGLK
jgi:hypothetical protein